MVVSLAAVEVPLNWSEPDSSDEAIARDVAYAIQIGTFHLGMVQRQNIDVAGANILELGPGHNLGASAFLAMHGARVHLADRFLPPWFPDYSPKFYRALRDRVVGEHPVAFLDKLLADEDHEPSFVLHACAAEELSTVGDKSIDVVISNAVVEHLIDPAAAFAELRRVTRDNGRNFHQIDYRFHAEPERPLHHLLMTPAEFADAFDRTKGQIGTYWRPEETAHALEACGFRIDEWEPNAFVEDAYLKEFEGALRVAIGSAYRTAPIEPFRCVGGRFYLTAMPSRVFSRRSTVDRCADPAPNQVAAALAERWAADLARGATPDLEAVREASDAQNFAFFRELHAISMLPAEVLAGLAGFARLQQGAVIVGVGPFVGASDIAMSQAVKDRDVEILSIEAGGATAHSTRGTDNIMRDLRANLASCGVSNVRVLEGWAHDIYPKLGAQLGDRKIGMLFVDADGQIGFHLNKVKRFLAPDALIVLDDLSPGSEGKQDIVRRELDKLLSVGALTEFGVLKEQTWFGRMNGEAGIANLGVARTFEHDEGHAWWATDLLVSNESDGTSGLMLLEDGKPLSAPQSMHADVRTLGKGRFSHWGNQILFSASDNSDPNKNGRTYVARINGRDHQLNRP